MQLNQTKLYFSYNVEREQLIRLYLVWFGFMAYQPLLVI